MLSVGSNPKKTNFKHENQDSFTKTKLRTYSQTEPHHAQNLKLRTYKLGFNPTELT